jgi:hypothetical protein
MLRFRPTFKICPCGYPCEKVNCQEMSAFNGRFYLYLKAMYTSIISIVSTEEGVSRSNV